ncbi:YqaJ viral recombinase family nuclease [Amedibacillus sp. YH-ame6]
MSYIKHKIPESREEWKKNRLAGIGGSDASASIGKSPWCSTYTLWCEKTGRIDNDKEDNEPMRLGRDLEDYVAQRFTEKTGKKVRKSSFSFQSKEHPHMLANVDRLIVGEDAGLECKTTSALTRTKYDKGDIPFQYYIQCMHYMAVTGKKKWYIAILVLGVEFYWFEVNWNDDEILSLIKLEDEFWNCVTEDIEPSIDGSESTMETLKKMYPDSDFNSTVILYRGTELKRLDELKLLEKKIKTEKREIENNLKRDLENCVYGQCDTYKVKLSPTESRRVDSDLLRAMYPNIYEECSNVVKSKRLTIKEEG